jgi:hypothetical protein
MSRCVHIRARTRASWMAASEGGHGDSGHYRMVGMMKLESRAPFGHRAVTVFSLV